MFSSGSTNLAALDAIAAAVGQLVANGYEPSGIIVSPTDWFSSKLLLAKTTQGEYLLGDPAAMAEPRLWGLPVIVTPAMTAGNFIVLDAARTGYIADRENAVVRVFEQHADFAVRNMIAILCEERLALVLQLDAAMIYGPPSYAG